MLTVALTLALFSALVLILIPLGYVAVLGYRKARMKIHLHRMRRDWIAHNRRRSLSGLSQPFSEILTITAIPTTTHGAR